MPRRARLSLSNMAVHLIQRGNNRQAVFSTMKTIASTCVGWRRMHACYRYIELKPVRAGMVECPAEYRRPADAAGYA